MMAESSSKKIVITVKTPKEKRTIEVEEDVEIKEVCLDMIKILLNKLFY